MFLIEDGEFLVNELVLRLYNLGYYILDFCEMSQFEQYIRVVCGFLFGKIDLLKLGMMVNFFGDEVKFVEEELEFLKEVKLYIYGKYEIKKGCKMGYIIFMK